MVEIEWDSFMGIKPENMSERTKDELYEKVTRFSPDLNLDRKYLIHFVRVTQEILKFKAEQVELLTNELDDLAAKQGREEGSKLQRYLDEIEQLKEELEYAKRSKSRSPYTSDDDLKRELLRLEVQNEELVVELQEKENDLLNEKEEVEKYVAQVTILEKEKQELNRELRALQDELAEKRHQSLKDSPESGTQKNELTEVIRQKNHHISQLLEDMEIIEEENLSLRAKLTAVRDELSETTTHITEITRELAKLKVLNEEYKSKGNNADEVIKSLNCQIEELVEEKSKHNKQLDEYILMFNTKLQDWKDEMEAKNEEILSLKNEIKKISSPRLFTSDTNERQLHDIILQHEKQIQILQEELIKATEEINSSSELIEKLKEKQFELTSAPMNMQSIKILEEKVTVLEEKLVCAEQDAQVKAEEVSDLIIQLKEYESGVFGLSEAVVKIKKLEKKILDRDTQIEKLVEICNNLEIKLDDFEEQNLYLREKLGLSASEVIDTSSIQLKYKKDEELLERLKLQLDQKEEELIKIKLKYRKAAKYFKLKPPTDKMDSDLNKEIKELNSKLHSVLKENDALRKGMHEILESVRNSSGSVEVQSACLERLLEALDSRHISGWYHPAMRLQAQLSTEEGKNEELRNQIRSLRYEEKKISNELQNAYLKIQSLEQDMSTPRSEEIVDTPKTSEIMSTPKVESSTGQELKIIELESSLQELKHEFDKKVLDLENQEKVFSAEKENLKTKITELEYQNLKLKEQNPEGIIISELTSKVTVLERQVDFLKNSENCFRESQNKLRKESMEEQEKMLKQVLKLQTEKSNLLSVIESLEKDALNCVSRDKFQSVVSELANTKTKYQNAINISLINENDSVNDALRKEINLFQEEKEILLEELKKVKEKLIATEVLVREESVTNGDFNNEISVLANKLSACEVRELNEKQRSSHLEKINEMLKNQQLEIESRNKELLFQVSKLTEDNAKHFERERELEANILSRLPEEEQESLENKIKSLEKKCQELSVERDNIQELFEISQGQCRAFQEWKDEDKILLASTNEQILLLQSSDEDKAKISRLSHELAMTKLTVSQLTKKNNDLKLKITKLLSQNLTLELKVDESRRELFNCKKKHVALTEHLYETINKVRSDYSSTMPFAHSEDVYVIKKQLKENKNEVMEKSKELKQKIHEYSVEKEKIEMQLESLEDLKTGLKGDAKNLIAWHNKTTELRLKEAKCRRENEFLMGEMSQLESCLKKLNEEISALEEGNIEKEKEWERKQMLWETAQLQLCQMLDEKGIKRKKTNDAFTNTETVLEDILESQTLKTTEWKIQELEVELSKLRRELSEKEQIILMKEKLLNNLNGKSKTIELEESVSVERIDNAEKEALKVTIQSLQSIVQQKEETILKYQDLLKEGREEYSKACTKLQEELRSINDTLAAQTKTYNKLKNAVQEQSISNDNVPEVIEKYITKIHELEEELRECEMSLSDMQAEVVAKQREAEKWKKLSDERLILLEDAKRRFDEDHNTDDLKAEITKRQKEIDRLNDYIDLLQKTNLKTPERRFTETPKESKEIHLQSDQLSDCTFDKPQRLKKDQLTRELETVKRQLKFAKDESTRLREQIRLLQSKPPKRPKTTGSTTSRSDSRSSLKDESLTSKIKHLEELLTISKDREKELMDINQKKIKSVEEVARWDEKKKSQQTIQNLNVKLKEKEAEVEVLKNKNESFRNMVYKCERDKAVLEAQLKTAKGGPGGLNTKIERLTIEKQELEAEIVSLRNRLEEQLRHSSGLGAALLQEKLEEQERKLASFELASMGHGTLLEELERLKIANSNLEKVNLKLESENLALQLKLEKEKAEMKFLLEKVRASQDPTLDIKYKESDRIIAHLQTTIEKLREENKRLKNLHKEPRGVGTDKVRKDLMKLKDDHEKLRGKYAEAMDKNIAMENELKSCRYQIHLMEEKDLAETLARTTSFEATSELSQELIEVKAKLAHKNQLISRVKALLVKAAAKEKALIQQVTLLQSLVPKPCV